jgi:hypothetical protein
VLTPLKRTSKNSHATICSGFQKLGLGQTHATRPLLDNLHFEHFVKHFNLGLWLTPFDEMFKMEIVQQKGTSGMRLVWGA